MHGEPFAARGSPVANRKTVFWNVLQHSFMTHIRSWLSDSDTSFWLGNGGRKGVVWVYSFTCYTAVGHWKGISRSTDSNKDSLGRPVLEGFLLHCQAWGADTDRGQRQPLETNTSTEWAGKQERVWTRVTCVMSKIHWFDGLYSKIYISCNMRYLVMSGRKNCGLQGCRYVVKIVALMSVVMRNALF